MLRIVRRSLFPIISILILMFLICLVIYNLVSSREKLITQCPNGQKVQTINRAVPEVQVALPEGE